jgi:hypothetical protein
VHDFAGWRVCEHIKVEGVMGDGSAMYIAKSSICAWPSSYLLSTHVALYNFVQTSRSVELKVTIRRQKYTCITRIEIFFSADAVGMEITRESLKFPFSRAVTTVSMQITPNRIAINSFDAISSPFLRLFFGICI